MWDRAMIEEKLIAINNYINKINQVQNTKSYKRKSEEINH